MIIQKKVILLLFLTHFELINGMLNPIDEELKLEAFNLKECSITKSIFEATEQYSAKFSDGSFIRATYYYTGSEFGKIICKYHLKTTNLRRPLHGSSTNNGVWVTQLVGPINPGQSYFLSSCFYYVLMELFDVQQNRKIKLI